MLLSAISLTLAAYLAISHAYENTFSPIFDANATLKPVSRASRIPFGRISILLSPPAVREDARGLTGDPCFATANCTKGRTCRGLTGGECSVQSDVPCGLCFPPSLKYCSKHNQCDVGEVCARTLVDPFVCLSSSLVSQENTKMGTPLFLTHEDEDKLLRCRDSDAVEVDTEPSPEVGATHAIRPYPPSQLSFGNCSRSSDCDDASECIYGKFDYETGYECCGGRDSPECYCLPKEPEPCMNDFDCSEIGEVCMESFGKPARCVSRENSNRLVKEWEMHPAGTEKQDTRTKTDEAGQSSIASENSCIGHHHLNDFAPERLLYESHRVARVLCDKQNSCATPGHIVKYKGISMMMSSYCGKDEVTCSPEIMEVNSPRYSVASRVVSHTKGLAFTAFSARYQTWFEETILSALIHIGF